MTTLSLESRQPFAANLSSEKQAKLRAEYPAVFHQSLFHRLRVPLAAILTISYLCFAWWLFGVSAILGRADWDIAGVYLADWVSYAIRPDVKLEGDHLDVRFPRYSKLGHDPHPDWMHEELGTIRRTVALTQSQQPAPVSKQSAHSSFMAPAEGTAASTQSGAASFMASPSSSMQSADRTVATATSTQSSHSSFMAAPTVPEAPDDTGSAGTANSTQSSALSFMASGVEGATPTTPTGSSSGGSPAATPPAPKSVTENVTKSLTVQIGAAHAVIEPTRVVATYQGQTAELHMSAKNQSVTVIGEAPKWLSQRGDDGTVRLNFGFRGSLEVRDDKVRIRHRFWGWANFIFDTNSPFFGMSSSQVMHTILSGDRLDPDQSNLSLAWQNILNNEDWQHGDVWLKLFQTILMAFAGTLLASVLAFPLSFIAARNIFNNRPINQLTKRFFDFQRSVDMLIWALFFTRAFGPGPLAGISAIFFTDTGTLGKLYSEALENIDDKQREGVKAVGAPPVTVQRYGVMPQVLPLFASQALYFWESNTRSATIIGAVGAGGIGLKLWEAMRTNSNWSNVCYMVLLILLVVYVFDGISNRLRNALMGVGRSES